MLPNKEMTFGGNYMQGPSLEEVHQLLKLCEDILEAAGHGDYSNSNVSHGIDEGQAGFYRIFQEYKAKLQELTALFAKYPKSESEAVKAERERILGYLESVNNSHMIESVLTYEINRLREGKP